MKPIFKKLSVVKIRDAFRVEALEPRVLLSADPILGAASLILPDDHHADYVALNAYEGNLALDHNADVSYALVDQVLAASTDTAQPTPAPERQIYDLAALIRNQVITDGQFAVAANDVLKGSGSVNVALLNTGTVAPGYSPGLQHVTSYTQTANATLEIELGGTAPGTGYDQLIVDSLSSLDGKLAVSLWGGFKPQDGQVFEIMQFDTIQGKFAQATGLVQASDDIFFELVQDAHSLKLIAHTLDPLTDGMIGMVGGDAADGVGYFLNNDYFPTIPPLTFHGHLNLNGNLYLDGALTIDYAEHDVTDPVTGHTITANTWLVGIADGEGFIGMGGPAINPGAVGLAIHDADIGLAFIDPAGAGNYGWVLAHGVIGSVGVVGVAGLTISATNLAFDLSFGTGTLAGGAPNDTTLDLSATPLLAGGHTFNDDGSAGEYMLLSGHADLAFSGVAISADIGLSVIGGEVLIAASNVDAGIGAGGVSLGIDGGSFGLVLSQGSFAFEASGGLVLTGGDFASVTADNVTIRVNHLDEDLSGRVLDFADGFSYTFGALGKNVGLQATVTGLHAAVGGVFALSGDFAFESNSVDGTMNVIGQHAAASMGAGAYKVGVGDATLGMHISAAGTVLEAHGALDAQFGGAMSLTATTVAVRYNSTAADASALAIDAGDLSYVFGAGLMASLKEVAVGGASLQVGGFVQASGNLAVRRTSGVQLKLANGSTVVVDELTFGASDMNVFAGAGAGTPDELGVRLTDVDLAIALMTEQGATTHTWTALKAEAGSAEFVGIDALTLAATDITIEINKASPAAASVVDFAATGVQVATGPGTDVTIDFDGAKGATTAVSIGRATLAISDYVYISGSLYLEQNATVEVDVVTGLPNSYPTGANPSLVSGLNLIDGLSVDHKRIENLEVSSLMLSATDVDIFVGLGPYFLDTNDNGLFDANEVVNPDRLGFTLDDIDVALVLMNSTMDADPNRVVPNFFALQLKWDNPVNIDMDLFKFQIEDLTLNVNQGGAWVDRNLIHPYVDFASSFDGGLSIPVAGGGSPVVLDYSTAVIGVTLEHALLNVGDMFQIEGSFAFEKTTGIEVDVMTGLPGALTGSAAGLATSLAKFKTDGYLSSDNSKFTDLPVDTISFGASNVSIVIGNAGDPLFTLDNIDIGFVMMHASRTLDPGRVIPNMYAMKANWAHPLDVDWGFMQLQIDDLTMSVNKGSNWRGLTVSPYVDFVSSFGDAGMAVNTGGAPVMLDFTRSMIGVEVAHALIKIDDFFFIEGGFALEKAASVRVDIVTGFTDTSLEGAAKLAPLLQTGEVTVGQYSHIDKLLMSSFTIGLSDVNLFVGDGPYFVSGSTTRAEGAVGLVLENLDLGMVVYKDARGIVPRMWALSATADQLAFTGLDFLTMSAEGISVRANQGAVWAGTKINPYVNFTSTYGAAGLAVATGNAPVMIDFDNGKTAVEVVKATLGIDKFVFIQGGFAFERGERHTVNIDTGLRKTDLAALPTLTRLQVAGVDVSADGATLTGVEVTSMTIGMSDVKLFVGYGVPDFDSTEPLANQADVYGLVLNDVDVGISIMNAVNANLKLPKFTAIKASAGEFALVGGGEDFKLSGQDISVQLNWSAGWEGLAGKRPTIDYASSFAGGLEVKTGNAPVVIDYGPGAFMAASVTNAVLQVSQFLNITGDFAFRRAEDTTISVGSGFGVSFDNVRASSIEFGGHNLKAFVGVNGPYRIDSDHNNIIDANDAVNPDAVGLVINDLDFGMAILDVKADPLAYPLVPGNTKFTAVKAHAEGIGFVGFGDFISFTLNDLDIGINLSSRQGLIGDFTQGGTSAGYEVATGGADPMVLDFHNSVIEASVGHAEASIAGILTLQGGFAFQKKTLDDVTFNAAGVAIKGQGSALIVAGTNVYAFAGINGPYRTDTNGDGVIDDNDPANDDAIGLAIDNLDFVLALVTPEIAPGLSLPGVNFYSVAAHADSAKLVGTAPYLELEANDLSFHINAATIGGYPAPSVYLDYTTMAGGSLFVPTGTAGEGMTLDYDSNTIGIGLDAHLGLFDLFDFDASFDFNFNLPAIPGVGFFPSISLSGLGDLLPSFSPNLDFLKGALDFVKNFNLSIGFDPNFGLNLFGNIDFPDLSLDLGDFVHLRGDFQLNIGETFTGTMYTGLPTEVGLVEDLLKAVVPAPYGSVIDMLKFVGDVSSDYSRIDNVGFKGMSFGASNVYAFVGIGNPDYVDDPDHAGKLIIANPDDLVGFSMEGLDVGLSIFKADLPDFFKAQNFYSLYTHADALKTYGFGDVLKLEAQDITVEVNTGGKLFGGLMRSTADFAASFPADASTHRPAGFEVRTGGTPVYLNNTGEDLIGLDIGMAEIQVSEFLSLRGSLAFRKGDRHVVDVELGGLQQLADDLGAVIAGSAPGQPLPLQMEFLTLGGANLTGFAGVGGPYRYGDDADGDGLRDNINEGAIGLVIDNVDFGLAIMTPTIASLIPGAEQLIPKFVAAKAHVDSAMLVGVDPSLMSVQARDISININTSYIPALTPIENGVLQLFGMPSIDFASSFSASPEDANHNGVLDAGEDRDGDGKLAAHGYALPAGGNNAVIIDFSEEIIQAKVGYAQIDLAGFVQLSASMAFTKKGAETVTLSNGEITTVTSLAVGINDAYGFIGTGGYWQDTNHDGRISEADTPDSSAVGLAIEDLDLGLVVAKELVIGLGGIKVGVYIAAQADIDMIGLVGIDGATMEARDLKLDLNTGMRATITTGYHHDAATGAVSYDGAGVTFGLTTIDFSKSSWTDPDQVVHPGYAIETGNPFEPAVLNFSGQYLRIAGQAKVDMFDLVHLDGVFEIKASAAGLTMFADVNAAIGTGSVSLTSHATGLLSVTSDGVALRMQMSTGIDLGPAVELNASLELVLNTTGKDVIYTVPEEFRDVVHYDNNQYVISKTPPGKPGWTGMYVALFGEGDLALMNDALTLDGKFSIVISESGMELTAEATLDLPLLKPLQVTGTLGIVSGGLYGAFEVGGAGPNSVLIDGGAFEVTGHFLLQVNTTSSLQTVRAINPNGAGFINTQLAAQSLHIAGTAGISLAGDAVHMNGTLDLLIDTTGVQAQASMSLELGVLGSIEVEGAISFINAAEGLVFALRLETDIQLGTGVVGIGAHAILEINTSDTTSYAGVAAGTAFNLELDGKLHILAFDVDFHGGMSVVNDIFRLELDADLNFFNFLNVHIGGFIESDGDFEITGNVDLHVGMGPLQLYAGMSITFSNTRIAASIYGSLELEIDMGLFTISGTLAGFRGEIELTAASAHLAARVTIIGISVDADAFWSWGDPPVLATQVGDVLYLNMGDTSGRYGSGDLYDKTVNETYRIDGDAGGNITLDSLGVTSHYAGVNKIVARGGKGNDSIFVGGGVHAQLDFDGGEGNDSFTVVNAGANSVVHGGLGNDTFTGGSANGVRYYGDAGNDRFVGGDGAEIIDMGDGNNTIFGGGGNDTFYISGPNDTVDTGDGVNTIYVSGAGYLNVIGGRGYDLLVLAPVASTTALELNNHEMRLNGRSIGFTDALDRIQVTDSAALTTVTSANGASWGATDLSIDAAGLLDVQGAKFVAPDARLSISAAGIRGTLVTELAEVSIVNRGTAGFNDIVLREKDSLTILDDGRVNGGLSVANGQIDIALAGREALLSLDSGVIAIAVGAGRLQIVADDVDFRSGDNHVSGQGQLVMKTASSNQNYRIGGAAESIYGNDQSLTGATGTFDLGMRDLSALRDGFSLITIGHAGVTMFVGDVEDAQVATFNFSAKLRDDAVFVGDSVTINGDLQSSESITFNARTMEVRRQNLRAPLGQPDSGISAASIALNIGEQLLVSGWITGQNRVDINVAHSTGVNAIQTYGTEINSVTIDRSATISTLGAGSHLVINASKSVIAAGAINAEGAGSSILVNAGTSLTVEEGSVIQAARANASVILGAHDYLHLNSGSAVIAGAEFVMVNNVQTPVLTGAGATVQLNTSGELVLSGSLTSASSVALTSGTSVHSYADYFDTLPGKTLASTSDAGKIATIVNALNAPGGSVMSADLRALFDANGLDLADGAAISSITNYTPFASLSQEARDQVAVSLGYTVHTDGGYYNPSTGQFRLTLSEGAQLTSQAGYTAHTGLVFYKADADAGHQLVTSFLQGVSSDYSNALVNWGAAGAPAAGTAFASLTTAQKLAVASSLGYEVDTSSDKVAYYNYNAAAGKKLVYSFTEGAVTDYSNANIYWGAA
ncbi:MAG: calcium-binding protein, partial [Massilia sp.]